MVHFIFFLGGTEGTSFTDMSATIRDYSSDNISVFTSFSSFYPDVIYFKMDVILSCRLVFLFHSLIPSLSFFSGQFDVHEVHPSGAGSASFMQMVCAIVGVHQFSWCLTSSSHISSFPVSYFFPWSFIFFCCGRIYFSYQEFVLPIHWNRVDCQ